MQIHFQSISINVRNNFEKRCELIALGNGTACRETESWISEMMQQKILDANSTKYCIVSECGASVYSCSDVAKNEFPNLDVNLISAGTGCLIVCFWTID